jgi:hypothetical protein
MAKKSHVFQCPLANFVISIRVLISYSNYASLLDCHIFFKIWLPNTILISEERTQLQHTTTVGLEIRTNYSLNYSQGRVVLGPFLLHARKEALSLILATTYITILMVLLNTVVNLCFQMHQ